jgi:hypothetical protein
MRNLLEEFRVTPPADNVPRPRALYSSASFFLSKIRSWARGPGRVSYCREKSRVRGNVTRGGRGQTYRRCRSATTGLRRCAASLCLCGIVCPSAHAAARETVIAPLPARVQTRILANRKDLAEPEFAADNPARGHEVGLHHAEGMVQLHDAHLPRIDAARCMLFELYLSSAPVSRLLCAFLARTCGAEGVFDGTE